MKGQLPVNPTKLKIDNVYCDGIHRTRIEERGVYTLEKGLKYRPSFFDPVSSVRRTKNDI